MVQGFITGASFDVDTLAHPEVKQLRDKIKLTRDDGLDVESAAITVTLQSGEQHVNTTIKGLGSLAKPMQTKDLADKLRLALRGSDVDRRGKLFDRKKRLD